LIKTHTRRVKTLISGYPFVQLYQIHCVFIYTWFGLLYIVPVYMPSEQALKWWLRRSRQI